MHKRRVKRKKKARIEGRIFLSLIVLFFILRLISTSVEYLGMQRELKLATQKPQRSTVGDLEKKILDKEKNQKEKEEEETITVGVNKKGEKYSYDADVVAEKFKSYDFSNNGEKVVFLTFDDGSSTTVTPKILKILREQDVKATFFLTGKTIENGGETARKLVKEEFNDGHAIANHSYSHDYDILYPGGSLDLEAFKNDFKKTDDILKDILGSGFSTRVLRCPGGYMSWDNMSSLKSYLEENNRVSIDWNALNADAEGHSKSAQELVNHAISTSQGQEMVVLLMHDTYGKEETAEALSEIIQYFKSNGYIFKTLV